MLIFYHFADVDTWGGGVQCLSTKSLWFAFFKPFPKLLKYNQICFKTLDLVTENYKSSGNSRLGIWICKHFDKWTKEWLQKMQLLYYLSHVWFWKFRVSSLKAGYKSSDQTSWRLKTKFWIWLIGSTWFDQHWSSSRYNSDFWNSHPGALPRIF